MPNSIKASGDGGGFALQVTEPARAAGLVDEDVDGEATRLAPVRVYAFDNLLLVIDREQVNDGETAALIESAVRDTESIHRAMDATVSIAGHGYQVQLPPAVDAGFDLGDTAPCQPAPGCLLIHRTDHDGARVADDLLEIRRSQVKG